MNRWPFGVRRRNWFAVAGGVGAVIDSWLTCGLGGNVKREFVARQQLTR